MWLNQMGSTGWTICLTNQCFCSADCYRMEIVPYRLGKCSQTKYPLGGSHKRDGDVQNKDSKEVQLQLCDISSSHLLYELNCLRRPGRKPSKPSILWTILPVNWSCSAGRMSFKEKLKKYGFYPISLAAGTGGFLLTSESWLKTFTPRIG